MPCPRTQRHLAWPGIDLATFRLLVRFPNRSAIWLLASPLCWWCCFCVCEPGQLCWQWRRERARYVCRCHLSRCRQSFSTPPLINWTRLLVRIWVLFHSTCSFFLFPPSWSLCYLLSQLPLLIALYHLFLSTLDSTLPNRKCTQFFPIRPHCRLFLSLFLCLSLSLFHTLCPSSRIRCEICPGDSWQDSFLARPSQTHCHPHCSESLLVRRE